MSGGHFNGQQFHIGNIADSIQDELDKQGKEIPREDRWHNDEWYNEYPEDKFYPTLPEKTQEEFKNAIRHLRIAEVYAQRIDYLLSGDDGDENFHNRLKEDLNKL
jgi:hypothetical protein